MKIGLFGGSFNPAHQGHIYISELAIQKLALNQVWWIPTSQNPLKEKSKTPYKTRLEGCLEITKNHPKICVKNFEKDSISTYKLVKKIKAQYADAQFYWVMGADNLEKFHLWKNFLPLIKLIEFTIFSRANFLLKAKETRALQIYHKAISARGEGPKEYLDNQSGICKSMGAKLPKFSLFKTKNYDISSSAIRNNS